MTLRIVTRGSSLALIQSRWVAARLLSLEPGLEVEIVPVSTEGDRKFGQPLAAIGGKGVWVKDLERALLDGESDLAVHSAKDVPVELPPGLILGAFPEREDPRDALVLPAGAALAPDLNGLPLARGARVGASSLRRQAQLLARRPDLRIEPIRGNVDTRLRKLDSGEFDVLVLAAAGLRRMDLAGRISRLLDPAECVPAPGQGALAIECRANSSWLPLLTRLDHSATRACVAAERGVMARLGGGCMAPFGAYATLQGDRLRLVAVVARPDGSVLIRETAEGSPTGGEQLAAALTERLFAAGAAALLAAL